jgi:hypothetical protein
MWSRKTPIRIFTKSNQFRLLRLEVSCSYKQTETDSKISGFYSNKLLSCYQLLEKSFELWS